MSRRSKRKSVMLDEPKKEVKPPKGLTGVTQLINSPLASNKYHEKRKREEVIKSVMMGEKKMKEGIVEQSKQSKQPKKDAEASGINEFNHTFVKDEDLRKKQFQQSANLNNLGQPTLLPITLASEIEFNDKRNNLERFRDRMKFTNTDPLHKFLQLMAGFSNQRLRSFYIESAMEIHLYERLHFIQDELEDVPYTDNPENINVSNSSLMVKGNTIYDLKTKGKFKPMDIAHSFVKSSVIAAMEQGHYHVDQYCNGYGPSLNAIILNSNLDDFYKLFARFCAVIYTDILSNNNVRVPTTLLNKKQNYNMIRITKQVQKFLKENHYIKHDNNTSVLNDNMYMTGKLGLRNNSIDDYMTKIKYYSMYEPHNSYIR